MNHSSMDVRRLRSFLAVADELHFRRAALRVGITQPALSQQIAALEEDLAVKLFERTRRRVELTEPGRVLADRVRRLLAELQYALDEAQRAGSTLQRLRLGYVEYAAPSFYGSLLVKLRAANPEVIVERRNLWSAEVIGALAEGSLDVGFAFLPITHPTLVVRPMLEGHWVGILPKQHPLAQRPALALNALEKTPVITFERSLNPPHYDSFIQRCEKAGFVPRVAYTTTQPSVGLELVEQGVGVLVQASYVARSLPAGLVARPIEGFEDPLRIGAVWRADDHSPATRKFIDVLRKLYPKAPAPKAE